MELATVPSTLSPVASPNSFTARAVAAAPASVLHPFGPQHGDCDAELAMIGLMVDMPERYPRARCG
jgi:hypothetical protein